MHFLAIEAGLFMKANATETDARILIDGLLRAAGWDPSDKKQVRTEVRSAAAPETARIAESEAEYVAGRCDYVLTDSDSRPLAVIEAKRGGIDPYVAKQQALPYAKAIGAPFIFLSNGEVIYFWDYENDDARPVSSFFSRRDLERIVWLRKQAKALATLEIPDYYMREGETRQVRIYQKDCIRALDHAIELGKRRFLVELPTGMGKTDLTCLFIKRLMQAGRAERILFLVDREQLAKQALAAIQDVCGDASSYWLQAGMERQEQQITVCLLQTMISRYREFTSGYFDLVVMDEAHRSIYGAWQAALTHFDAFHLGLTATPAAYIERNTYKFYNCRENTPDFSYPIQDAFREGYLVPYKFAQGITQLIAEGTQVDGENYDPAEFERKWTNEDSNRKMMEEFDRLAHESFGELAPKQKTGPGKAIVFAITKHHAARLARYLNDLHPEAGGRYAEVITSDVADADAAIQRFKRDTYPMVAVSVDMLTTGFDCRDALHLVLARRIFSPILYQQIRGRGTRRCDRIGKRQFVVYDFFRNQQHFNDSETEPFEGPGRGSGGSSGGGGGGQNELIELGLTDEWLEAVTYVEVGPEGERIDKKDYVTEWEKAIKAAASDDGILKRIKKGEPLTSEQEAELERRLNQPTHYFNEDNLRRAYRRPGGSMIDFIKAALGGTKLKSREEETTENFQAWLITKSFTPEQASYLALLKNRGLAKGKIDMGDLFQPPLSILDAASVGIDLFGENGLRSVISEMNESLFPPARRSA